MHLINLFTFYNNPIIQSALKSLWAETTLYPQRLAQGLALVVAQEMSVEWVDSLTWANYPYVTDEKNKIR